MSFFRSAAWLSGTQVVNLVLTLLSRILLARALGTANFGAFGAATNAMTVSSRVFSLGTASGSQYFASRKDADRGAIVGTSLVLSIMAGALSLGLTHALLGLMQQFFLRDHPQGMQAVLVMAWSMPAIVVAMNLGVMLIPFGRVRAYSTLQLIGGSAFIIPCLILLRFLPPLEAATWAQVAVWTCVLGTTLIFLRGELRSMRFDQGVARRLLGFGLRSWPNVCLNIGIASFSTLFGAQYLSPAELSLFVLAMNIVEGLFAPHVAIGQLVLSKTAQEEDAAHRKTYQFLRVSLGLFALLTAVVAAIGWWLIPAVFGAGFAGAYSVCVVLMLTGISHALMRTMANAFSGIGRPGMSAISLSVEMAVFFAALQLLGPAGLWGLVGASVAAALVGWTVSCFQIQSVTPMRWSDLLIPKREDWGVLASRLRKRTARSGTQPADRLAA